MLTKLQALWARLNPHAVRIGLFVLACLFGVLLLVQTSTYLAAVLARYGLNRAQHKAETAHAQRVAHAQARTSTYRVDSTRYATQRRHALQADSILAQTDAHLTRTRPARVVLPASPEPGN